MDLNLELTIKVVYDKAIWEGLKKPHLDLHNSLFKTRPHSPPNRYFYKYTPPRPLEEIETDLKKIEKEIADMLAEVTE